MLKWLWIATQYIIVIVGEKFSIKYCLHLTIWSCALIILKIHFVDNSKCIYCKQVDNEKTKEVTYMWKSCWLENKGYIWCILYVLIYCV